MSTMRVAIAGTGGLAWLIAHYIQEETSHNAVFLSRSPQPRLVNSGYQVAVVDYNDSSNLTFALRGIDTVISTVTGPSQIELIKAAVSTRVRRFIPAEFSGPPELRVLYDQIDSKRVEALHLLDRYSGQMPSTYFVCGIFYEHFQPGGLGSSGMGAASGFNAEGDYIMNCRSMETQLYVSGPNQQPNAAICMTSVQDVARYVCKALDLPTWPKQIRMYGARLRITDLISKASGLRGQPFRVQWHSRESLRFELQGAISRHDRSQQKRIQAHINTAEGRYVFSPTDLQQTFGDARTIDFDTWFSSKWAQG